MTNLFLKTQNRSTPAIDPRLKFTWLVINVVLVIHPQALWQHLLSLMVILLVNQRIGLALSRLVPFFKITALAGLQLLLLQGLLHASGTPLFSMGPWPIYSGGLLLGLQGLLVVSGLALSFFQFLFWTSTQEITGLLIKMRVPFKYAFTAGLAVRYLPLLQKDLRLIRESQSSRGLRLDGYFKKIIGLPPIILPLLLKTLNRVEGIALSMEMKGFGHHPQVTVMQELKFGPKDRWTFLVIAAYGALRVSWF
jgi:energy-coupling factor transport system permease protein